MAEKQNSNSNKKTRKSSAIVVLWIVAVSAVLITCIFVCANVFVIIPNNTEAITIEFISAVLSIVGLAVAVWAGLSITNAIAKKHIDDIDEQIDSISIKLEKNSNYIDTVEEQQNNINKEIFINSLMSNSKDLATRELISFFESDNYVSNISFLQLIEIEELFKKVYLMHESKFVVNNSLLANVDKGVKLAEKLLEKSKDKTISVYIKYRKAEFMFYAGYCCTGEERLNCFMEAIKIYEELFTFFDADVPIFDIDFDYLKPNFRECNKKLKNSAYFCNSIGEAYSKISETRDLLQNSMYSKNVTEIYGKKAIFYCSYAVNWFNCETYLRNLGCAIERHYKVTDQTYDKLYDVYNRAFNISATINSFKVIMSICDKYFNHYLKIGDVNINVGRITPLSDDSYKNIWNSLEQSVKEKLLKGLFIIQEKSIQAKTIYPSNEVGYIYSCIYHRNMCLINGNNKDIAKQHYSKAIEDLNILKVINPKGALTKILSDDLDALS